MQALYAFFQSDAERVDIAEKNLLKTIYAIYDLYIYQLSYLIEIVDFARESIENSKNKYFPSAEEANPNTRFVDNFIIKKIEDNPDYIRKRDALKINWADQKDMIRRSYLQLKDTDLFKKYLNEEPALQDSDLRILELLLEHIAENDDLQQYFEEKNVFWADDFDVACFMVLKTLQKLRNSGDSVDFLPKLFGNKEDAEKEDVKFLTSLFCKTILQNSELDNMIESKVDNWEIDRIALIDTILLKMALIEFMDFPSIPTKVTINEYIDISKMYSTPKSKVFINGVLDKLLFELLDKKKIKKTGRGLIG